MYNIIGNGRASDQWDTGSPLLRMTGRGGIPAQYEKNGPRLLSVRY